MVKMQPKGGLQHTNADNSGHKPPKRRQLRAKVGDNCHHPGKCFKVHCMVGVCAHSFFIGIPMTDCLLIGANRGPPGPTSAPKLEVTGGAGCRDRSIFFPLLEMFPSWDGMGGLQGTLFAFAKSRILRI